MIRIIFEVFSLLVLIWYVIWLLLKGLGKL
jgi:hypothetical protein